MKIQLPTERFLWHGMIIMLVCTVMLLSLNGCRKIHKLKEDIKTEINSAFDDDFYSDYGGRDYVRIPLIAPYELLSLENDSLGSKWDLIKRDDICVFGGRVLSPDDYRVMSIGVCDSILYLSCKSTQSNEYKFIIVDTTADEIMELNSIQELSDKLSKHCSDIDFANVDSVYSRLNSDKERCSQKKLKPNIFLIIHRIVSSEKTNGRLEIDSIRVNSSRIKPLKEEQFGDFDSVAYLKYRYPNGNIRREGWVSFSDDPENDFSQEFGEWRYYDNDGNCYRKFWNYKKGDDIINETIR